MAQQYRNNQIVKMATMPIKTENRYPSKNDVYAEFILWFAMPVDERVKLGIENQGQFADYYHVNKSTLSDWKDRTDFAPRVDRIQMHWGLERTGNVIKAIYNTALKGNPFSQQLWLQYFKKFNVKEGDGNGGNTKKVEVTVNDIRFLISQLPEELKQKHYDNLRDLLDDVVSFAEARDVEGFTESSSSVDGSEMEIQEQTNTSTQDVRSERADELATRHTFSVCTDMADNSDGRTRTSSNNYQSTERWW